MWFPVCVISSSCRLHVDRGGTVIKVLCYKSEGRWFDPSWCHWSFSLKIKSFRSHYGPGLDSASNRNEFLFVCLFVFGATAPSGPGPPHSRGF